MYVIVECRCYAALMDKVQMWGRQLKGSKEYFLLLTATYSEAFITMSIDWDLNSVREHWTGILHTYLIRKQFSMEYHTPYPFLVGKLWNIKHASRCSCKLILDHHSQTSSSYITIPFFTHTQLTLQNHWKNHRGSQSSNRECQIKVGSILNFLTNINKEQPEKMNQL